MAGVVLKFCRRVATKVFGIDAVTIGLEDGQMYVATDDDVHYFDRGEVREMLSELMRLDAQHVMSASSVWKPENYGFPAEFNLIRHLKDSAR